MKLAFLLAMAISPAIANDLAGTWEASFAGDTPGAEKPASIGFDLYVTGDKLAGMAFMGAWGVSYIFDGKMDGDHFSFTVERRTPPPGGPFKVAFAGSVEGKRMNLTMTDGAAHAMTVERVESKVVAPVSVNATAEDVTGSWKAWWVGRIGDRPKMIAEMTFDFQLDGNTLTGVAHLDTWPGGCPITEGRFEAGHFSFTALGQRPSSSGLPVFKFEGTIHGKEMKLVMVQEDRFTADKPKELPMDARKL